MFTLKSGQTVEKIVDGAGATSSTAVAILNADGSGAGTITLQLLVNSIANVTAQLAAEQATATAITALGITLPIAA